MPWKLWASAIEIEDHHQPRRQSETRYLLLLERDPTNQTVLVQSTDSEKIVACNVHNTFVLINCGECEKSLTFCVSEAERTCQNNVRYPEEKGPKWLGEGISSKLLDPKRLKMSHLCDVLETLRPNWHFKHLWPIVDGKCAVFWVCWMATAKRKWLEKTERGLCNEKWRNKGREARARKNWITTTESGTGER